MRFQIRAALTGLSFSTRGEAPGGVAAATKHWQTAATHLRKALELKGTDADFFD
jgi:hypothetical protein